MLPDSYAQHHHGYGSLSKIPFLKMHSYQYLLHKLRKTYASRLNAAGIPLDQIRANLGHASLTATLGYIYNPLTPEESLKLIEKAFDD